MSRKCVLSCLPEAPRPGSLRQHRRAASGRFEFPPSREIPREPPRMSDRRGFPCPPKLGQIQSLNLIKFGLLKQGFSLSRFRCFGTHQLNELLPIQRPSSPRDLHRTTSRYSWMCASSGWRGTITSASAFNRGRVGGYVPPGTRGGNFPAPLPPNALASGSLFCRAQSNTVNHLAIIFRASRGGGMQDKWELAGRISGSEHRESRGITLVERGGDREEIREETGGQND
jgi:hypothetical protein